MLPFIGNANDAHLIAVNVVIEPIVIEKISGDMEAIVNVPASLGINVNPQYRKDERLLLINADMPMYQAKSNGKN